MGKGAAPQGPACTFLSQWRSLNRVFHCAVKVVGNLSRAELFLLNEKGFVFPRNPSLPAFRGEKAE